MKIFKKILKAVLVIILVAVLVLTGIIVYAVITDYKPKEKEIVFSGEKKEILSDTMEFSVLTWNIGYCGLDKEMDFFYDGGTKVITPKPQCLSNLSSVSKFQEQQKELPF
jgi:hypothetical protein